MATLDWSQCPTVESGPGRASGAWVFRDTRLLVATVIENLEDLSVEEVMEQFDVTREQIIAVLDFVAQSLKVSASGNLPRRSRPRRSMLILFDHGTPKRAYRCARLQRMEPRPRVFTDHRHRRGAFPPLVQSGVFRYRDLELRHGVDYKLVGLVRIV
jgi:uncharacterized protein (DUF433 family)